MTNIAVVLKSVMAFYDTLKKKGQLCLSVKSMVQILMQLVDNYAQYNETDRQKAVAAVNP